MEGCPRHPQVCSLPVLLSVLHQKYIVSRRQGGCLSGCQDRCQALCIVVWKTDLIHTLTESLVGYMHSRGAHMPEF